MVCCAGQGHPTLQVLVEVLRCVAVHVVVGVVGGPAVRNVPPTYCGASRCTVVPPVGGGTVPDVPVPEAGSGTVGVLGKQPAGEGP